VVGSAIGFVIALAGGALLVSTSLELLQPAAEELAVWSPSWRRHSAPCWRSLSVNSGRDDLRL